jgi:hypothetical protein
MDKMSETDLFLAFIMIGMNVVMLIIDSKINKLRRRMDKIDGGENE